MMDFISSSAFLAFLTFLWYRKGRLWNFYDSLRSKSEKQINDRCIDRDAWEEIALKQCEELSKDLFNSLFRFEVEYLRNKILTNKYNLWVSDILVNNKSKKVIYDKTKYCSHELKSIYYNDFRFCGLLLFVKSLKYKFHRESDEDPGYSIFKK